MNEQYRRRGKWAKEPCCDVIGQCSDCGYGTPKYKELLKNKLSGKKVDWNAETKEDWIKWLSENKSYKVETEATKPVPEKTVKG
jgi:hypothetical protein